MNTQKYIPLVARTFIALIFLQSAIGKITDFPGLVDTIAGKGLPLAFVMAAGTIAFQLLGSISLILGYKAKWGALLLILFLIPATIVFHNFIADPSQKIAFLKNLGLMGGALMVIAYGSGPLSLEPQAKTGLSEAE
ncbi:DoxX family protein [Thalassoporum mexicanum PCC 7367]|uniref:DoxX family protein n=1 Tax=Thalassoporum mexicanum TaxID=3457544 RepID=UPI00029FA336|nr:DoxX family protein [Pseudanabaena sp. PCC 7367]AFY68755.1 DoxX family protein [Pseudanabaena sp. PCC 7367]